MSLAPCVPHLAIGGFDVAGEEGRIGQRGLLHPITKARPQLGQVGKIAGYIGGELDELIRGLADELR